MKNKPHKLFISHSSKDAEYMKAFVDLLVAIGVHKNQITSLRFYYPYSRIIKILSVLTSLTNNSIDASCSDHK